MDDIQNQLARLGQRVDETKRLALGVSRGLRDLNRQPHGHSGSEHFLKHAVCHMFGEDSTPQDVWRTRYAAKGASNPALTTVPEWAGILSAGDTMGFLLGGTAPSLFARLLSLGMDIGAEWTLRVPYRSDGDFCGDWIAEGEPAPVESIALTGVVPVVRKIVSLSTFSRDLRKHSTPQIETILDTLLRKDINAICDRSLVDDQPSSVRRPAGLLHGAAPTPGTGSLLGDLQALAAAVLDNGGSGVVFMTGTVTMLGFANLPGAVPYTVLDSPFIAPNRIIAIDPQAFVGSLSAAEIDVTEAAVVHEENATPAAIVDGSGAVARPVRSLWQTATVGMRCILDAGWSVVPGRVQFVDQTP